MRAIGKGLFQCNWQPQLQLVRNKTKVNVTKPRPPHFERALLEHVCHPYFLTEKKPKHIPDHESCVGQVKIVPPEKDHPLKTILTNQSLNWFKKSKLIAFFHSNAANPEEIFECQLVLKKNGMKLLFFNKQILRKALTNTIFEGALDLYNGPTATAFSQESDLHKLLGLIKKLPKLVFMAAAVENKLLSLSDVETYGKFKNLDEARATLLSTLMSSPQSFVQQLSHPPANIVEMLHQYKNILGK